MQRKICDPQAFEGHGMAAAFPLSTAPPLPLRHSAAGPSPSFRLQHSHWARRGKCAVAPRDGRCARRLPAAAADAKCGRTQRAPAVVAAQGQAAAGENIHEGAGEESLRMVLLSTAVAVCGSFEFGTCVSMHPLIPCLWEYVDFKNHTLLPIWL